MSAKTVLALLASALLLSTSLAQSPPPPAGVYPANNTWNGCLTQFQVAAFEWFYTSSPPASTLAYSYQSLQTFLTATCSIPFNSVTNALKPFAAGSAAEANFKIAASVLYNEVPAGTNEGVPVYYGEWSAPSGYTSGDWSIDSTPIDPSIPFNSTLPYKIVRDYATAVCRNLPVAYLMNSNLDSLQYSPVAMKLTGTGVQTSNIYTGCLKLNNDGVFFNQTTPIGSLPLNLTVVYVPNSQNPSYARLTGYRWVPGNTTQTPVCQQSPICSIYNKTGGDVTSRWLNNGMNAVSLPIDANSWYSISCMPDPACLHNGLYDDLYFTTFVSTNLNPIGASVSYFNAIFNLPAYPSPPPSPSPPSPPPPRPSPPSPLPPPSPPLPPPPACEPYWPPACDYVWVQVNALIQQNDALLYNITVLQEKLENATFYSVYDAQGLNYTAPPPKPPASKYPPFPPPSPPPPKPPSPAAGH